MKITRIEPVLVGAPTPGCGLLSNRNYFYLLVHTDEGITGLGEATLESHDDSILGALRDLEDLIVGQDPTRIGYLMQVLIRQRFWKGGVVKASAISGIELACWDILGKSLGKPVWQLLGGAVRDKIRVYANGWSGDRIQVIFNAVDLDAWAGGRADSTLRAELGLDEDRFVMLCASRFAEDKGHKYLIDSVKRLTERTDRPFTLVLAGDGPLLEPTKAQVAELGLKDCVKFIGFRKDMKNLYKGADLYVNSSQHEALSFLIIEAMAAGLPVIATDMGGNSDIVNDEAGCGLLVEYDNPDSMASAMKRFLEEPEFLARCRENARKTIEDKFEIHKMCRATYGVYEKALHD